MVINLSNNEGIVTEAKSISGHLYTIKTKNQATKLLPLMEIRIAKKKLCRGDCEGVFIGGQHALGCLQLKMGGIVC